MTDSCAMKGFSPKMQYFKASNNWIYSCLPSTGKLIKHISSVDLLDLYVLFYLPDYQKRMVMFFCCLVQQSLSWANYIICTQCTACATKSLDNVPVVVLIKCPVLVCSDYETLLQQLQNTVISSGDSFYVRVNMSLSAGPSATLAVSCNDILHVTNTRPTGTEDSWHASQVHPSQLLDLQSGTLPNYYRSVDRWGIYCVFVTCGLRFTLANSGKESESVEYWSEIKWTTQCLKRFGFFYVTEHRDFWSELLRTWAFKQRNLSK